MYTKMTNKEMIEVFVPFLGDFLSMNWLKTHNKKMFVFVPFLGDFLSISCYLQGY